MGKMAQGEKVRILEIYQNWLHVNMSVEPHVEQGESGFRGKILKLGAEKLCAYAQADLHICFLH